VAAARTDPLIRSITLSPHLAEAARGRAMIAEVASQAGFLEERVFDITVASSEAIANAIEHSPVKGEVQVRTILRADRLEVEVRGPGEFQAPDRLKNREGRGLGLPLMAKLSDHLALFSGPKGETFVSLTFYRPGVEVGDEGAVAPSFANLAEENRLLDDVLKNFPEGFYVLDEEWRIIYMNPAVAHSVGRSAEELLGRVFWEAFPEREAATRPLLERVRATGSTVNVTTHDARGYWTESTAFPVEEGLAVISRDITRRMEAEEQLREHSQMLDLSFEAIFAWQLDGPIVYWNQGAERLYGFGATEAVGRVSHELLNTFHPAGREPFVAALKAHGEWTGELAHTTKDCRLVVVETRQQVVIVGDLSLVLETNRDITERKAAEEALRKSRTELEAALDSMTDAVFISDLEGRFLEFNEAFATFHRFKNKGECAKSFAEYPELLDVFFPNGEPAPIDQWAVPRALRGQTVTDAEYRLRRKDTGESWIGSYNFSPIRDEQGRIVGSVVVGRDITEQKRTQWEREQSLMEQQVLNEELGAANEELTAMNEELASQAEDLVERERSLRESEERYRTLFDTMDEGFAECELVRDETGMVVDYRFLALNPAVERNLGISSAKALGNLRSDVMAADPQSLARYAEAVEGGRPVRYELHSATFDRWFDVRVFPRGRDRFISLFDDITKRKRAEAAERELRAALSHELVRSRQLLETAETLAGWTDLTTILDRLAAIVVEVTGHGRASIGLFDPDRRTIRVAASAGKEPMAPASAPLSSFSGAMQDVVNSGASLLVDYELVPERERQWSRRYNTRFALLVPLVYRARVVGVILVDDPGETSSFTEEERRLIEGIGAQAAVAIENARLYEAQKSIADQLQKAILEIPEAVENVSFSHLIRSATEEAIVGGDFYDVLKLRDGSVGLVVGDVSGHGVNAARTAGMIKSSVAALAADRDDPAEILGAVNRLLVDRSVSGFTSVLFVIYRPATGMLSYCSAGHPNLLIGHADGRVEFVGGNHAPLGVFSEWSCSVELTQVESGDTLLLYTDGLTEARSDGRMFGEKRLRDALGRRLDLPLEDLPRALLDEVLAFTKGHLQDDAAILAVRPLPE
jgi:PAS domain S-box-containing protein